MQIQAWYQVEPEYLREAQQFLKQTLAGHNLPQAFVITGSCIGSFFGQLHGTSPNGVHLLHALMRVDLPAEGTAEQGELMKKHLGCSNRPTLDPVFEMVAPLPSMLAHIADLVIANFQGKETDGDVLGAFVRGMEQE